MRLALAAVAAVLSTGCGGAADPEPAPGLTLEGAPSPSAEPSSVTATPASSAPVTEQAPPPETASAEPHARPVAGTVEDAALAREIALGKVPGGTVIAQDLEDDAGVWEVHVAVGREVHELHVHTGERRVTLDEVDTLEGDDARALEAGMTIEEAIRLAAAEVPGTITDVQFDDGRWEVDIETDDGRDYDLAVDPTSGRVTGIS